MQPHINTISLGVSVLARAVAFYRDGLGLPLQNEAAGVAIFGMRGARLMLVARDEMVKAAGVFDLGVAGSFGGFMLTHAVASQPEVEELLRAASKAGANVIKPATDTDSGGTQGFFFRSRWLRVGNPLGTGSQSGGVIFLMVAPAL